MSRWVVRDGWMGCDGWMGWVVMDGWDGFMDGMVLRVERLGVLGWF